MAESLLALGRRWEGPRRFLRALHVAFAHGFDAWCHFPRTGRVPYELRGRHAFVDRARGEEALLVVLAGYKPELWDETLPRIVRFLEPGIDVCVACGGKDPPELRAFCARHGWSYLAAKRNNACLVQNLVLAHHPRAKWIYKVDEDVFLTEGFFRTLRDTFARASSERIRIGFVAPLIPLNGWGCVRVLEKLGLVDAWRKRFGALAYADMSDLAEGVYADPRRARFLWGEDNPELADVDRLNARFAAEAPAWRICPFRFSIGAILLPRATWEDMGHFPVSVSGNGMGADERHLAEFCMCRARAIVVSENSVVGHFAYGPQTADMLAFRRERTGK